MFNIFYQKSSLVTTHGSSDELSRNKKSLFLHFGVKDNFVVFS